MLLNKAYTQFVLIYFYKIYILFIINQPIKTTFKPINWEIDQNRNFFIGILKTTF